MSVLPSRPAANLIDLSAPAPINTVLFDFHSTLVDQGSGLEWIAAANERLVLNGSLAVVPADAVGFLEGVWEHARAADPTAQRDLSSKAHREVFARLMRALPDVTGEMIEALYDTLTSTWHAYEDAAPVLRELRRMEVRLVVLSNTGIDIRPTLARQGLRGLVDAVVLSHEAGCVKPDPEIFRLALDEVGALPSCSLMVGDSPHEDNGAAVLGIRTLILPRTEGPNHGLQLVPALVATSRGLRAS